MRRREVERQVLEVRSRQWELNDRLGKLDYREYTARQHRDGDTAGRMLTLLLRFDEVWGYYGPSGEVVNTQVGINDIFRNYYQELYPVTALAYMPGI